MCPWNQIGPITLSVHAHHNDDVSDDQRCRSLNGTYVLSTKYGFLECTETSLTFAPFGP
jgi:hypothetical protein